VAVNADIDPALLKDEIKKTYASLSREPDKDFIFPTGRAWAVDIGYPEALLARIPETAVESFAGVANPFALGPLAPGSHVLDIGSGAGTDSLVAAQMVAPEGRVTGVDRIPSARRQGATSTSGPAESQALCWTQSTQHCSSATASSRSSREISWPPTPTRRSRTCGARRSSSAPKGRP